MAVHSPASRNHPHQPSPCFSIISPFYSTHTNNPQNPTQTLNSLHFHHHLPEATFISVIGNKQPPFPSLMSSPLWWIQNQNPPATLFLKSHPPNQTQYTTLPSYFPEQTTIARPRIHVTTAINPSSGTQKSSHCWISSVFIFHVVSPLTRFRIPFCFYLFSYR